MADIVGDEACPSCREQGRDKTGNHLIVFSNGNKYCNRCLYREGSGTATPEEEIEMSLHTVEQVKNLPCFGIPHKQIKAEVADFYGVRTSFDDKGEPDAIYYPHTVDGKITGYKQKCIPKKFLSVGNCKEGELFGQSRIKQGGNLLIITEGEDDALTIWQVLKDTSTMEGWIPPVVSLSHGASTAVGDVARNLEYVTSFKKIVIAFDSDDAGQDAVAALVPLLPPGKVFVASYGEKDASDMLVKGKADELKWDIVKHAKAYQPDGIVAGSDTWERYKNSSQVDCIPYPSDWAELNKKTYGFRFGSVVTLTSGTGMGKTQLKRELEYHIWRTTKIRVGDISLEEDVGETVGGLMSLHAEQRLHLPDVQIDAEREKTLHDELFADGRFTFYDHFGGMDDENLFNKIRFLGATGHKVIFLDHLSIVVSEFAAEGDERQRIDTVMTKLAKIAKELELAIFIIVHLRKEGSGRSFEQGTVPSLDDLRGSGSLKQLSWDVIAISRNQQHHDARCRNISKLTVLKCRFTGNTGEADHLEFSPDTGRMSAVEKPPQYDGVDQ